MASVIQYSMFNSLPIVFTSEDETKLMDKLGMEGLKLSTG